jgi:hypothetical protein
MPSQVHNDPHVLKFDYAPGQMVTCNNVGTMTLVDNEYFRISAEGEMVASSADGTEVSEWQA